MKTGTVIQKRLTELRAERGFTWAWLSRKSGVSVPTISLLSAGKKTDTNVGTAKRLAKALDVTLDFLVGDEAGDSADNK